MIPAAEAPPGAPAEAPPKASGAPIAFFDLDKTLLAINSGSAWVRFERAEGRLSLGDVARASGWLVRYHLGSAALDGVLRLAISRLAGEPEAELTARTERFWRDHVAAHVRPAARAALAHHRAQGHRLALLTTASIYLARPAGAALGLDTLLCNRFEVADGRFTGAPIEPLCFAEGKVTYARQEAARCQVSLADCWFYTDSASDRAALEAVGHPVVVNPDPKLKRLARRRGWPVVDWSR